MGLSTGIVCQLVIRFTYPRFEGDEYPSMQRVKSARLFLWVFAFCWRGDAVSC